MGTQIDSDEETQGEIAAVTGHTSWRAGAIFAAVLAMLFVIYPVRAAATPVAQPNRAPEGSTGSGVQLRTAGSRAQPVPVTPAPQPIRH